MTKRYAITGGATGIGAAVKNILRARGDEVIVVDIRDADIVADLATPTGREAAVMGLQRLAPDGLDGFIPCAGLGPNIKPVTLITQVNYFGALALTQGVRPLLQQRRGAVVMISSNSAPLPGRNDAYVKALLAGDEAGACQLIAALDGQTAYGGGKYALAVWMRKQAPQWIKEGVRMNAVAPGITRTAMTDGVMADQTWGKAIKDFGDMTPCGYLATPEMIAASIVFLLDPVSQFVCGSVLFIDGGMDALLRPEGF